MLPSSTAPSDGSQPHRSLGDRGRPPALPCFILIRVAELCIYPILTLLVGLPRYRHADWVNVSRHKFTGLVGHDLIWCLYCDWMTGVYSLGAEMLRNVESFWCPIRFASGKKCDTCKLDFPDIHGGWVAPEGTMGDVVATLEKMYGAPATADLPRDQRHPSRPPLSTPVVEVW